MKYNAIKASVLTMIMGASGAAFAAGKAPLAEDAEFAAFRGIETMRVSEGELREVWGSAAPGARLGGPGVRPDRPDVRPGGGKGALGDRSGGGKSAPGGRPGSSGKPRK
uniref:Uncharacterized protein n=1 Tax=Candidatus Kentrum sp. TC TaxID=2126339 RepID=A0A450YL77_9GAMM|nr:MAG: hypothetical protein BECKTC1821E_GA0114239_101814 [Candidatus Kentron sp. TC]